MAAAKKKATTSAKKKTAAPARSDRAAEIDKHISNIAKGKGASAARTALSAMSDDEITPRLLEALKHEDERMRSVAVEMATVTPRRRELTPLEALTTCLRDASAKVRMSTLVALNRGWGPSNGAVYAAQGKAIKPALAPLLKDPDARVAKQAAIIWGRLGLA